LAELWSTYRINEVELIFYPNMNGQGACTPTVSAIDPAGSVGPVDSSASDIQVALSRLRSVDICSSYKPCRRKINFSNWLVQTVEAPYLPTVTDAGTRGVYAQDPSDSPIIPSIRMVTQ